MTAREMRIHAVAATVARCRKRLAAPGRCDHRRRRRFARGQCRGERIAARQSRGDCERRHRSIVDLRLQAPQDRALDLRIEGLHDRGRRQDAGLLALVDQLSEVLAVECALAGEEFIEHEPERIDIAARRDLVARQLLRRHVGGRAGANRFARRARQPEVRDADLAGAVEHHVRGLEVAVDDVALVSGGEPGADLTRDLERALFREPADALQQRREVFAVHVLHRQECRAVDLVDVVHAAHVGVRDLARHADFGMELCQPRRIAVDVGRQELQRDRLTELQIVGAIHLAHAAAAAGVR